MEDKNKTQKQLIRELTTLRQRIADLEATGRKRIDDTSRETSLLLKSILDSSSSISIVFTDLEQNILFWNKGAENIFGYKAEEVVNRHTVDILYPDEGDTKQTVEEIRSYILNKKRGLRREIKEITKDGRILWISLTSTPRLDENANVIGILGIGEDITERKQAEKTLEENEARFRQFFEHEPAYCYIISPEGIISDVNNTALGVLGYKKAELVGKPLQTIYAPESMQKMHKLYSQWVKYGQLKDEEMVVITKKGERRTVLLSAEAVKDADDKIVHSISVQNDITERKNIEDALKKSEERFRKVVETMEVGLGTIDENGVLTYVNEYMAKMLGYSIDEMIGRSTLDFFEEESRKAQKEILKKRRAGMQDPTPYEVTWIKKDGQKVYSILSPTPLFDSDGHYTGSFAIHTDITERKLAEEALRESAEKYRIITSTSMDGFAEINREGRFLDINEESCRMSGYSKDEHLTMSITDLEEVETPGTTKRHIQNIIESGSDRFESRLRRKDGSIIEIEASSTYFPQTDHLLIFHRDITERKKAADALCESAEKYRQLFELESDALFLIDNETGRILEANVAASNLYEYSRYELLNMKNSDLSAEPNETYRATIEEVKWVPVRWHRKKDGTVFPVEITGSHFNWQGRPVHIAAIRDITERKRVEENLQHSYQQMQDMLITTVNALASTIEMKDQYTAGHQSRVAQLACAIAEDMGLPAEQINGIRMASLIHDIGKIMVPAEILNKPGPLTEIQYEMIKMHPEAGYDILKEIKFPWPVAQIILQHHERMDGSGYPQGLSGEAILLEARILAVANIIEAMVSHRPYRAALTIKEALMEISKNKGTLYDPVVVDACKKLFAKNRFAFKERSTKR